MAYEQVNGQWPEVIPALEGQEAIAAARRLYRLALGKAWEGEWRLTSGRRFTWPEKAWRGRTDHGKGRTFYVNPMRGPGLHGGWRDLVHMLSHYCHAHKHPTWKPHGPEHHALERRMVAHVIASGWLDGRLRKAPKPEPDRRAVKAERTAAAIQRWEAKERRAANALKKLRRQARRLELSSPAEVV
jgi:hypothetical protein